jgi:hypothetical protein
MREKVLLDAFAGRLVASPPHAEPAPALLEGIRKSIALLPSQRKGTSMPKTKRTAKLTHPLSLLSVLRENNEGMTPEQLFAATGHAQDSIDQFFAELRELTAPPAAVLQERTTDGLTILRAVK